ncbi:hypothetical protein Tco_0026559 [Tanacetum coccineum]
MKKYTTREVRAIAQERKVPHYTIYKKLELARMLGIDSVAVLWLRTQLTDYGFHFDKIPMYCDSKAAIAISFNPVQHSRTKHTDLADLFTKALSEDRFKYLVRRLGLDDGVAASFQRSRIHKPHAHTQAFKVNRSTSR